MSRHTSYLICYDITDPARLRAVHRLVDGYGQRLQYSVYRCSLTDTQKVRLEAALRERINHREDRVLLVELGPTGGTQVRLESMGQALPEERAPGSILI